MVSKGEKGENGDGYHADCGCGYDNDNRYHHYGYRFVAFTCHEVGPPVDVMTKRADPIPQMS